MSFLLHYTQNMGDCQTAPHISWANLSCLAHIFRLSISLVYDSRVVVKKSRHEKYLFLICFFKSGHDDSMPCKVLVCKGLLCLGAGNTPPVCVPDRRLAAEGWRLGRASLRKRRFAAARAGQSRYGLYAHGRPLASGADKNRHPCDRCSGSHANR